MHSIATAASDVYKIQLHDAVQLGKIFDLDRQSLPGGVFRYRHIIVDAPATGHGLTMLSSAGTMMELTRAGPMFEGVRQVYEVLSDPVRAGIILVCLPEEMPTNETIDLWNRLDARQRSQVRAVVLNSMYPSPFSETNVRWPEARARLVANPDGALLEGAALMDRWLERLAQQQLARQRLQAAIDVPLIELPHRFEGPLSPEDLLQLGQLLLRADAEHGSRHEQ